MSVVLLVVSAVTLLLPLALAVGAIFLIFSGIFGLIVLGLIMLLFAVSLRPRLPTLPGGGRGRLSPQTHPAMFALIEQVAAQIGAPRPDIVGVDDSFNAYCGRTGLKRERVLNIGLSLWASLEPSARAALLGHELGHLINGDPDQRLLIQPALTTFGRLAVLFNPRGLRVRPGRRMTLAESLGSAVASVLMWPIHQMLRLADLAVHIAALRASRRAEYLADAYAAQVGGTVGTELLFQVLLLGEQINAAIRTRSRTSIQPSDWWSTARAIIDKNAPLMLNWEQRSIRREASVFQTHPPEGLRIRMVRSWNVTAPALEVTSEQMAAIDRELAGQYEHAGLRLRSS